MYRITRPRTREELDLTPREWVRIWFRCSRCDIFRRERREEQTVAERRDRIGEFSRFWQRQHDLSAVQRMISSEHALSLECEREKDGAELRFNRGPS